MSELAIVVVLTFVFGFGLLSRRLDQLGLSPPLVFVGLGLLIGEHGLGFVSAELGEQLVHPLGELTLLLILFGDAARIDLRALRREAGLPLRLLGIGMPLIVVLGAAVAALCFGGLSMWEAALLAAVLTPTDAALGQAVVSSEEVPPAVRQALNVESGLNDGIALPLVMVCAALASAGEQGGAQHWLWFWLAQVGLGPVAGVAVALVGGKLASWVCARGWMGETYERIAGLGLAILSYFVAELIGGNGFIAAFVGGLVLGNRASDFAHAVHSFLETEGQILMIGVFTLVGATWAFDIVAGAGVLAWVYALASLTLIRMVPVAIACWGTGLRAPTIGFLGWFGPRGLASVLFALLVVEREGVAARELVFEVAMLTVLLSVVAHGLSARPAARRYGAWAKRLAEDDREMISVTEHPTRLDHDRPASFGGD